MRVIRGFTMVEMLVVAVVIFFLVGLLFPTLSRSREQARRSSCANDVGCIVSCCHLYSDQYSQLGSFPSLSERQDHDGRKAMAMLYGSLIKDHRVFSCPSNSSNTSVLRNYDLARPDRSVLVSNYTHFGYDPGHTPVDATVGVVSDRGVLNEKRHRNSMNHGGDGQNVAIGAGSVEWWDVADQRATKNADSRATTDDIFADNWDPAEFPDELETNIIE